MPECLLLAYADEMPRLQAMRSIQAASSSHPSKEWVADMLRMARRTLRAAQAFTLNGRAVSVAGFRRGMADLLGGGFSNE